MSNLPARSRRRAPSRLGRTPVRSWLLALLVMASASSLGACLVEDSAAIADWQADTAEAEFAVTCEPPPPTTNPDVARRQAIEATTAANRLAIDPATGEPTVHGCIETSPSSCLWMCKNRDPREPTLCDLCCPGCGGIPNSSGLPNDAFPCDPF
jgi:hypothetical protein